VIEYGQCAYYQRLASVQDNKGYQLKFTYAYNAPAYPQHAHINTYETWSQLIAARALNMAVEACQPEADSCTPSQAWPTVTYTRSLDNGAPVLEVVAPGQRTWRYKRPHYDYVPVTHNSGKYIERLLIKRPDSASIPTSCGELAEPSNPAITTSRSPAAARKIITISPPRRTQRRA
jgi:hypothetical protein